MLESGDAKYLEIAVDFYNRLNDFSDAQLINANFSRKEIEEGLHTITTKYQIPL